MADEYEKIRAVVRGVTPSAVLLQPTPDALAKWVPRSLLHAGTDSVVDKIAMGADVVARVRAWKLRELGWIDG